MIFGTAHTKQKQDSRDRLAVRVVLERVQQHFQVEFVYLNTEQLMCMHTHVYVYTKMHACMRMYL